MKFGCCLLTHKGTFLQAFEPFKSFFFREMFTGYKPSHLPQKALLSKGHTFKKL